MEYSVKSIYEFLVCKLNKDTARGCLAFRGSVVSGVRSIWRNNIKKGNQYSFHLDGLAFDLVFDSFEYYNLAKDYFKNLGYRIVEYKDELMLHVQYDFPIDHAYTRENEYSHLRHILETYPEVCATIQREVEKDK